MYKQNTCATSGLHAGVNARRLPTTVGGLRTVRGIVARTGLPAHTANTHTDVEALLADLTLSRHRGYAIDEGEQEVGVRCFSVPLPEAPTLTAISVSGPAARVTKESADRIVPLLKRVVKELSAEFETNAL